MYWSSKSDDGVLHRRVIDTTRIDSGFKKKERDGELNFTRDLMVKESRWREIGGGWEAAADVELENEG